MNTFFRTAWLRRCWLWWSRGKFPANNRQQNAQCFTIHACIYPSPFESIVRYRVFFLSGFRGSLELSAFDVLTTHPTFLHALVRTAYKNAQPSVRIAPEHHVLVRKPFKNVQASVRIAYRFLALVTQPFQNQVMSIRFVSGHLALIIKRSTLKSSWVMSKLLNPVYV